jgi:hypothetical protein
MNGFDSSVELRRNALEIFVGNVRGKRPLGGPRRRWVGDVWALSF